MPAPMFVAEMGGSHNGSLETAKGIVKAAAWAGADAVKLQTFDPDEMVGPRSYIIQDGPWAGRELRDLYRQTHTPRDWHAPLFDLIREHDMTPFSTPLSKADVDFLETLDCPIYKISSFELVDLELIRYAAATGKPLIISTGMASRLEIGQAHQAAAGRDVTLLQCVSAYPASCEHANLAMFEVFAHRYRRKFGLSDHTIGSAVAVAATVLGACVIEKHLTIHRGNKGPDDVFASEPKEFAAMVEACKQSAAAIGRVEYGPKESEQSSTNLRRSLYFARDLSSGTIVTPDAIRTARPGLGLSPLQSRWIYGRRVSANVKAGDPVTWDVLCG